MLVRIIIISGASVEMRLWGKQMMIGCFGDQAVLLRCLKMDLRCQFLDNILKMHQKFLANKNNLSQEKGVGFLLEHTWLIFADAANSLKEKEIFAQVTKIYETILLEGVSYCVIRTT